NRKKKDSMLSTTARTSCASTAASSLRKRATGDAGVAGVEAVGGLISGSSRSGCIPRVRASRYAAGLLAAKLFIAPPDEGADAAPQHADPDPEGRSGAQPEACADQPGLHPGRGQIPEAVEHGVDDVLRL